MVKYNPIRAKQITLKLLVRQAMTSLICLLKYEYNMTINTSYNKDTKFFIIDKYPVYQFRDPVRFEPTESLGI
jgi:hypothetical protein